jgi:hypothetical protein
MNKALVSMIISAILIGLLIITRWSEWFMLILIISSICLALFAILSGIGQTIKKEGLLAHNIIAIAGGVMIILFFCAAIYIIATGLGSRAR